jgi:hypothetical protein
VQGAIVPVSFECTRRPELLPWRWVSTSGPDFKVLVVFAGVVSVFGV